MKRTLTWTDDGKTVTLPWISESEFSPPKKISIGDDRLKADDFYRQASQGGAFVYKGDFQNAKQLLQAVQRRIDKMTEKKLRSRSVSENEELVEQFHRHRQSQAHKAQILSRLLICVEDDLSINLKRAPQVAAAITEALDGSDNASESSGFVVSLRELLGYIGAHEWRKKGVAIEALGGAAAGGVIHPRYGIFSPVRGEYLDLVATAPLPAGCDTAFDIGTGTGVIAAILAKRGVSEIIATDLDQRALACARENIERLGYDKQVEVIEADLFPDGEADLIVCNPPWLPARPTSSIERAVYDEDNQMLMGFLDGVGDHLTDGGEAWLILSDLAERLGLREPNDVRDWIKESGLVVIDKLQTRPKHSKALDTSDPLYKARSEEITCLWRLKFQ